ncbi:MAG: hypothetical protein ACK4QW_17610 [Alphaproteobacteria bacterium]
MTVGSAPGVPRRIRDGINENPDPTMAAVATVLILLTTILLLLNTMLGTRRQTDGR